MASPTRTLRDGQIEAAIWSNTGQHNQVHYSVTVSKNYKQGEEWKKTSSFSSGDLLQVAHLLSKAYDAIAALKSSARTGGVSNG